MKPAAIAGLAILGLIMILAALDRWQAKADLQAECTRSGGRVYQFAQGHWLCVSRVGRIVQ